MSADKERLQLSQDLLMERHRSALHKVLYEEAARDRVRCMELLAAALSEAPTANEHMSGAGRCFCRACTRRRTFEESAESLRAAWIEREGA